MLILYTTEDGRSQIKLRTMGQTVWLSQREMSQLFDVSTDNVGLHLKNIFEDGELSGEATTEESSVVQIDAGTISHQMEMRTDALYLQFDQDRKRLDAIEADQQDEADLQALETQLKRRPKQ
jgi:hypothetical protein